MDNLLEAHLSPPEAVLTRREALQGHFIAGTWQRGRGNRHVHVYAADHAVTAEVALASPKQVGEAVGAAVAAYPAWRAADPAERAGLMRRLAALVLEDRDTLRDLQILDTGLTHGMSHHVPVQMARWIDYYAGWADKVAGSVVTSVAPPGRFVIDREPCGVVGVLLPWNVPINGFCMKAMAALAAGNCVVVKSPEIAPFGMMCLAELIAQAGFPPGVISVLAADGEGGQALCSDPRVAKLSFTGGGATAAKVVTAAAPNATPTLLELGGKSATLLFEDADLDKAVPLAAEMGVAGTGQVCILSSRLLVQQSIYDEVIERVRAHYERIAPGDPFLPDTRMGPMIGEAAAQRVVGMVDAALDEGAGRLVTGGGRIGGRFAGGAYVEPTLFADVRPDSGLFQNEVFGPVLAVTPFADEAEAIRLANDTRYGLYSYLHTRDGSRAMRVARALHAGSVAVNGFGGVSPLVPFGGFGLSGHGKEGGREGLDEFLRSKSIFVAE